MTTESEPSNIDVDFVEAMRPIGGVRPIEIDPNCERDLNADLVFLGDQVIAEVKTLIEDPQQRRAFNSKLSDMHARWVREGLVGPVWGTRRLNTQDLPYVCGRELADYVTRRVKADVQAANRQIKRTKASLGMRDASGLLVLCNAGCPTLSPHSILWALDRALGAHNTSIRWVIYLTDGLPVRAFVGAEPTELWVDTVRRGGDPIPTAFAERMRDAWFAHKARAARVFIRRPATPDDLLSAAHIDPIGRALCPPCAPLDAIRFANALKSLK